ASSDDTSTSGSEHCATRSTTKRSRRDTSRSDEGETWINEVWLDNPVGSRLTADWMERAAGSFPVERETAECRRDDDESTIAPITRPPVTNAKTGTRLFAFVESDATCMRTRGKREPGISALAAACNAPSIERNNACSSAHAA